MGTVKKYLDIDVYEASKERIKHIIEMFDTVLVAFSGGKDSLTVVHLVKEVYAELGIKEKVKVFFRDEEIIPDEVINFVRGMAESGEYDFRYYAIPLYSSKFILGTVQEYIQWDKNRAWLRQPPDYAITMPEDNWTPLSQYDSDTYICQNEKGKVAILNGIRADESLIRLRSCINKKNENYINATKDPRIKICKPIYDWTVKDIFTYFCKKDIKYCSIYDKEMWNNMSLRVSTPLHAESAKQFYKNKTLYPIYYQQIIDLFPEMLVQDRYWSQYSKTENIDKYEHSFKGIVDYINENITDAEQRNLALYRVRTCYRMRKNNMAKGDVNNNFGGYPVLYVFNAVINGQFKRVIQPIGRNMSQKYIDFEVGNEQI